MEIVLNQIGNGSSLDTYIGREEGQNHKGLKSWGLKASSSETFQQVWQDCSALQSINWCLKSWRIATFAGSFEWKGSRSAVTGLANFDFTPLLWCPQGPKGCLHCCMKCPQILREKTLSQKFAVIALRIQWKLFTEGNAFKKCQQIILPLIIINAIIFRGQN